MQINVPDEYYKSLYKTPYELFKDEMDKQEKIAKQNGIKAMIEFQKPFVKLMKKIKK